LPRPLKFHVRVVVLFLPLGDPAGQPSDGHLTLPMPS
jgi:hypothetical protein